MKDKLFISRQLNLMLQFINSFEKRTIDLRKLVDNLEALLNIMELEEDMWKDNFLCNWGILEDIYSIAVTSNITILSEKEVKEIESAIEILKDLINTKLKHIEQD